MLEERERGREKRDGRRNSGGKCGGERGFRETRGQEERVDRRGKKEGSREVDRGVFAAVSKKGWVRIKEKSRDRRDGGIRIAPGSAPAVSGRGQKEPR